MLEFPPTSSRKTPKLNYERFNRNSFNIHSWSWNYRGCWHQTCPPIVTRRLFYLQPIPIAPTRVAPSQRHWYFLSLPRRFGTE